MLYYFFDKGHTCICICTNPNFHESTVLLVYFEIFISIINFVQLKTYGSLDIEQQLFKVESQEPLECDLLV